MQSGAKTERLNITLPRQTVNMVDRLWPREQFASRSAFLNEAACWYVRQLQKSHLRKQLKAGYLANASRDLAINKEWAGVEPPWPEY